MFATKADDRRKPSLYFKDENGNFGIIRQEHKDGPGIFLNKSLEWYFLDFKTYKKALSLCNKLVEDSISFLEKTKEEEREKFAKEKTKIISEELKKFIISSDNFSREPFEESRVIEILPTDFHIGHTVIEKENFSNIGLTENEIDKTLEKFNKALKEHKNLKKEENNLEERANDWWFSNIFERKELEGVLVNL